MIVAVGVLVNGDISPEVWSSWDEVKSTLSSVAYPILTSMSASLSASLKGKQTRFY